VLAFLLRLLVPPDLLLLGYGRPWTETEGRFDQDEGHVYVEEAAWGYSSLSEPTLL
jgi:hypothetical protein